MSTYQHPFQKQKQKVWIPNDKLECRNYEGGIEAEMALLGAVICMPNILIDVEVFLTGKNFYSKPHEIIFELMKELCHAEKDVGSIILCEELKKRHQLATVGDYQYIATLVADIHVTPSHAVSYAKIVKEWYILRELERSNRGFLNDLIKEDWDPEKVVAGQIKELEKIQDVIDKENEEYDVAKLLAKIIDKATTPKENQVIMTGYDDLDTMRVLKTNELTVIAARPSVGKTCFVMNIISNVCDQGIEAIFFSVEMDDEAILTRFLSCFSGIDSDLLEEGYESGLNKFSEGQMRSMHEGAGRMMRMPLEIIKDKLITTSGMRSAIRKHNTKLKKAGKNPVGLVVIDYLQFMKWSRKDYFNEGDAYAGFCKDFKDMASRFECSVVLISQLNREVEKRADMRPKLSELRGSGAIEQDADIVILLSREDYQKKKSAKSQNKMSPTDVNVAKNRNGATGDVSLHYYYWRHKFQNPWEENNKDNK